jgi:hypothetical protein
VAKRTRSRKHAPVVAPVIAAPAPAMPAATRWERFWLYELSWVKWCTFRFAFFGLLAVDAVLQLPHAPRYGAGGFNVQHLPGAPLPEPGRISITFVHAALSLLFALVAQGILTRVTLPLVTILYGWAYFSSQLDAFQHHYLVFLLLVCCCFVPHAPTSRFVTSWAVRLALVQVGIVYLWAAISKMTPLWLDGTALDIQITRGTMRDLADSIGPGAIAKLVLVTELALAAVVWMRPAWPLALAGGLALHAGVELVDLDIGLFSYLMFAVYLLVIPDRVYLWLAERIRPRLPRPRTNRWAHIGWVLAPLALVLVAVDLTISYVVPVVLAFVLLAASGIRGIRRAGWAFVLAAAVPLCTARASDVEEDYFRYWAGQERRLGDKAEQRQALEGLREVDPASEYAAYYLGLLEEEAGNHERALAHYRRAPRSERCAAGEARVRLRLGATPPPGYAAEPPSRPPEPDDQD